MRTKWKHLKSATVLFVLSGAIFLNLLNLKYAPFWITTSSDELQTLAGYYWERQPHEFFYTLHEKYLLHDVFVNPDVFDFVYISFFYRFGTYLEQSNDVPERLTAAQFEQIDAMNELKYSAYWSNNIEYRLYETRESNEDILLTVYDKKVLFIPMSLIEE